MSHWEQSIEAIEMPPEEYDISELWLAKQDESMLAAAEEPAVCRDLSFRESIRNMPVINKISQVAAKGMEIARAAKADIVESDRRRSAISSLLGMMAVSAVGATKAPSVLALPAAIKVQKETGIPPASGLAAGTLYGVWCYTTARAYNSGVNNLPRTFAALNSSVKRADKLSELLPGLSPAATNVGTRAGRGSATYGTGIMPYIVAAGIQNQSAAERRGLCANLGRDGGSFLGLLATGATGAAMALHEAEPELAERVVDYAGNSELMLKLVVGAAAGKLAVKSVAKQIAKRRSSDEPELKLAPFES